MEAWLGQGWGLWVTGESVGQARERWWELGGLNVA